MGIVKAIPLTEAQAKAVETLLEAGICADASEVVAAGLATLARLDAGWGFSAAEIDHWVQADILPTLAADVADPSGRIPAACMRAMIEAWGAEGTDKPAG